MARYFFHLRNSFGYVEDEEGEDLPGLDAAREAAINSIRSIVGEDIKSGVADLRGTIDVADETGRSLLQVSFDEAVEVRMGPPPSDGDEARGQE